MMPTGEIDRGDDEGEGQFRGDGTLIRGLQRMIDMGDVQAAVFVLVFRGVGGQKEDRGPASLPNLRNTTMTRYKMNKEYN